MSTKTTKTKDDVMKAIMDKYGNDVVKEMLGLKLGPDLCMNDIIEAQEGFSDELQAVVQSMPFSELLNLKTKGKRGPAKSAKPKPKTKDNGEPKKDNAKKFDVGPAQVQAYLRDNVTTEDGAMAAKEIARAMSGDYDVKNQDDAQAFFRRIRHVLGGLNKNDMVGVVGSGKGTKYYHKEQDSAEPEAEPVAVPAE